MGSQSQPRLDVRGVMRRLSGTKRWVTLFIVLISLPHRHRAAADSSSQVPPATPPAPIANEAFTQWSQRCMDRLRAAQKLAARTAPFVKKGTVALTQMNHGHHKEEEYPHYHLGADLF